MAEAEKGERKGESQVHTRPHVLNIQSGMKVVEEEKETTITISLEGDEVLISFSVPAEKIRTLLLRSR